MSESELYDAWVADGKPWRNATPIAELVAKLRQARPAAAAAGCFGSIGNLDHLLADPPQDHCPYSQTGWPLPHPYPYVTASDIMHRPDLGVDCNQIHANLLAAAKAGRLPWLKYWIWQGKRYDIRNNWVPVAASGHYDHIHISARTDHITTSLGGWHPLPGMGGIDMIVGKIKGNPACWLGDGVKFRPIQTNATLQRYLAMGVPLVEVGNEAELLDLLGEKEWPGPDPITLTAEQLAELEAAATAGAQAGVVQSADELVEAFVAALPDDVASRDDVVSALREVLLQGVAATPQG